MQQVWNAINSKMRRKIKLMDNKGYHTLEAAIVIPFSLVIIALLITWAFSLYNRCTLERAAVSGAIRASELIFENGSRRNEIANDAIEKTVKNNILGRADIYKNIEINGDNIDVSLETTYRKWKFITQSKKKVMNPVAFIRLCRKVKGVVE